MQTDPAVAQPLLRSLVADDMDEMSRALTGGHADFVPLRSGRFAGRFTEINLGGIMVRRIVHGPMLMHGSVRPGHLSVQFVAPATELTLNGARLTGADVALLPGDASLQARFDKPQDRVGLVLPEEAFEAALAEHDVASPAAAQQRILPLRGDLAGRISRRLCAMTEFAEHHAAQVATTELAFSLAEECRRLLANAMAALDPPKSPGRMNHDVLERVRKADAFLRAHIARPVYGDEICAAIGVAPRTLHQSFTTVYGMAPATYLRRRRLLLVRRALMAARGGPALVKSVALAHGFWHLGRFAHEYAAMFGEAPSATLGRGRVPASLVSARSPAGGFRP